MTLLILGLALWYLAHGVKIFAPGARAGLAQRFGEGAVKGGAALALLASVALMVIGYQQAPFETVWFPPGFLVHVNNLLMLLAVALFTAGAFKGHLRHWVRHPQLTGFKTWAVAHLLVNGDLASIVLFGGLLAWGVLALIGINKRDGKGPKPAPGTLTGNILHLAVAGGVFVAVALAHHHLGVWPFAG